MVETKLHNERGEEPTHKSIPCYYVDQIFRSTNSSKSCLDYAQVETSRPTCMFRNLTHTQMVHFSVISQINLWITIKRILHCSKKLLLNETHWLCDIIHWQVISIILGRQSRTYKDWKLKLNSKKLCTVTQCYSHCSDLTYLYHNAISWKDCSQHWIQYIMEWIVPWDNGTNHTKWVKFHFRCLMKHRSPTGPGTHDDHNRHLLLIFPTCINFIDTKCEQLFNKTLIFFSRKDSFIWVQLQLNAYNYYEGTWK